MPDMASFPKLNQLAELGDVSPRRVGELTSDGVQDQINTFAMCLAHHPFLKRRVSGAKDAMPWYAVVQHQELCLLFGANGSVNAQFEQSRDLDSSEAYTATCAVYEYGL